MFIHDSKNIKLKTNSKITSKILLKEYVEIIFEILIKIVSFIRKSGLNGNFKTSLRSHNDKNISAFYVTQA